MTHFCKKDSLPFLAKFIDVIVPVGLGQGEDLFIPVVSQVDGPTPPEKKI